MILRCSLELSFDEIPLFSMDVFKSMGKCPSRNFEFAIDSQFPILRTNYREQCQRNTCDVIDAIVVDDDCSGTEVEVEVLSGTLAHPLVDRPLQQPTPNAKQDQNPIPKSRFRLYRSLHTPGPESLPPLIGITITSTCAPERIPNRPS